MFRGQRWSEKTWPALKFIQITGFFSSDFIKIIWTLHVYGKKCAHSFCATGPNCSHRQKIMPQNVISHREKDWHLCTKKTSSGIFLQVWVSFPSIFSDIRNWDPAACFWNEKRSGGVLSRCAWALVTIWKRNEWFSGDAWCVSKVGRVHN